MCNFVSTSNLNAQWKKSDQFVFLEGNALLDITCIMLSIQKVVQVAAGVVSQSLHDAFSPISILDDKVNDKSALSLLYICYAKAPIVHMQKTICQLDHLSPYLQQHIQGVISICVYVV